MQYTDKVGVITKVGPKKTEFANGSKVTIGGRDGKPSYPGVSVGVQFDFDKDVWYSGIVFEKQADALKEGATVNVKTWEKESGGKVYKNFAINSPKKADTAELEKKVNSLITTVERHSQQILAIVNEMKGDKNDAPLHEYNSIEQFAQAGGLETTDMVPDLGDISPDDINY